MARHRLLPGLAVALGLLALGAWLAWWGIRSGTSWPFLQDWAAHRQGLTVATGVTLVAIVAFRAVATALRDPRDARSLGHLQTIAALVLAVLTFAVLAGDLSSTLISLGLVGFGLTLALQRPILALAGWATIIAGRMFREGDRIQVGELEGDVLAITLFTTRLWEIGQPQGRGPGRPTARILSVSNAVFLEQPVANATSDTPVVFDEFVANVAYEADLDQARALLVQVADEVLDPRRHEQMAKTYRRLTRGLKMEARFPDRPVVLLEARDSWMDLRLRYLVDAREAALVQTRLTEAWDRAGEALPQVYPRSQPMPIGEDGRPQQQDARSSGSAAVDQGESIKEGAG